MDFIIGILIDYGYWGMLLAAFLAGSFLPFSSEAVMVALQAAGLDPWGLIIYGTIGNVLGGMLNYGVGRMGKTEWIEKYLHVKKKDLDRAMRFMAGHGAWMGFFAFLPLLGSAITIALGLMRSNIPISFISITTDELLRYVIIQKSVPKCKYTTAPYNICILTHNTINRTCLIVTPDYGERSLGRTEIRRFHPSEINDELFKQDATGKRP